MICTPWFWQSPASERAVRSRIVIGTTTHNRVILVARTHYHVLRAQAKRLLDGFLTCDAVRIVMSLGAIHGQQLFEDHTGLTRVIEGQEVASDILLCQSH